MVDGETITEKEASAPDWIDAIRRRAKPSPTTGKPAGTRIGVLLTKAVTSFAAASRLPPLPTGHHRVIIHPGGGLNARRCNELKFLQALPIEKLSISHHKSYDGNSGNVVGMTGNVVYVVGIMVGIVAHLMGVPV
ncbi:hypothetical protein MRX96_036012 [Rhipicephalus microplus]